MVRVVEKGTVIDILVAFAVVVLWLLALTIGYTNPQGVYVEPVPWIAWVVIFVTGTLILWRLNANMNMKKAFETALILAVLGIFVTLVFAPTAFVAVLIWIGVLIVWRILANKKK